MPRLRSNTLRLLVVLMTAVAAAAYGAPSRGAVKKKAGEVTDSPELQAEGVADQASGKVKEGVGTAKRKVSEAIEDLTED